MTASRHSVRQREAVAAEAGSPSPLGCGTPRPLPPPGGARGFQAESRRERWSPEPGHLMGGALGDEGMPRATGRPWADGGQAPAKTVAPVLLRDRGRLAGAHPGRRVSEHAGTASEGGERRHELDML
jgi:hypothetical protein